MSSFWGWHSFWEILDPPLMHTVLPGQGNLPRQILIQYPSSGWSSFVAKLGLEWWISLGERTVPVPLRCLIFRFRVVLLGKFTEIQWRTLRNPRSTVYILFEKKTWRQRSIHCIQLKAENNTWNILSWFSGSSMQWKLAFGIGRSGEGNGHVPPSPLKCYHFHAVFGKIYQTVHWRPPIGVGEILDPPLFGC